MKTKQELRNTLRQLLKSQTKEDRIFQQEKIQSNILKYISENNFQDIALYSGVEGEIQTKNILEQLLRQRKRIYLPKIVSQKEMQLIQVTDPSELRVGKFGILESDCEDFYEGNIDVFLIPGVAFTKNGKRLGRGKGYYDRFIGQEKYKTSKKVGICYDFQILEDIPTDTHDVSMDFIITT